MPSIADRVQETSASTGTGNFSLSGASSGYRSFNTAFGTNCRFWYSIVSSTGWEIGIGYLTDSTTLVREKILESTNSDFLVDFSSGTKQVFCTQPSIAMNNTSRGRAYASGRGMDMM